MKFELEQLIPTISVTNLEESIEFYTTHLGFNLDWKTEGICSVSRENKAVMLTKLEQNGPSVLWIGVEDINPIYEYLTTQGVSCLSERQNWSYAYDMRFADPSGNILWFGSEPLAE